MQSTQLKLISSRMRAEIDVHITQHELPKRFKCSFYKSKPFIINCHENATLAIITEDFMFQIIVSAVSMT